MTQTFSHVVSQAIDTWTKWTKWTRMTKWTLSSDLAQSHKTDNRDETKILARFTSKQTFCLAVQKNKTKLV
jgi:hypothetical protein